MITWGLDLSTTPRKCAGVAIQWDTGRPRVVEVRTPLSPDSIVDLIAANQAQFAVDVPFGWPDTFVDFLTEHRRSAQRPPGDRNAWRKETLARRATDQRLAELGAAPLPASFDRLGKTAVMWSAIEHDLRGRGVAIDRSGMSGRVCETYPAAALAAWRLGKKKPSIEVVDRAFPWLVIDDPARAALATDDARDALVCALMARGRALGMTEGPSEVDQARREGWIHVMQMDRRSLLDPQRAASWLRAPLQVPDVQDLDEDWPKTTFDFPREDGTQVDSLTEFADALGVGIDSAAEQLVNYSFPDAVPTPLMREAWSRLSR